MKTAEMTVTTGRNTTKLLVINALFIALTLVATMFINIRLPFMGNGGLIHLGNVPLFIGAVLYGKKTGAIAGAVGMGLFDLLSGWTAWAPFTFVIVGLIGYSAGWIAEKMKDRPLASYIAIYLTALVIKIVGYYFTEVILYGNWIAPFGSVPGNLMQITIAALIVFPMIQRLKGVSVNV
ncbi:MAG: ECF transporter S component [Eubacteriales bacterium]|nr:ECF transporter S component [Eubacteriales bacterium]MDD3349350.1 ECF transporter S component [Eubacteriales bacterium]